MSIAEYKPIVLTFAFYGAVSLFLNILPPVTTAELDLTGRIIVHGLVFIFEYITVWLIVKDIKSRK